MSSAEELRKEREARKEQRRNELAKNRLKAGGKDDEVERERAAWRQKYGNNNNNNDKYSGDPSDKEGQLIQKAQNLQEDNLASLRRTIQTANEAKQVGNETITKLEQQGEQLQRIDGTLDEMNDSLSRSERIIRGMKSIGGSIANIFSRPKKPIESDYDRKLHEARADAIKTTTIEESEHAEKAAERKARESERDKVRGTSNADKHQRNKQNSTDGFMPNVDLDRAEIKDVHMSDRAKKAIDGLDKQRAEEDQALDELDGVLGQLKEQAQQMNTELTVQSKMLNRLDDRVDSTNNRIQTASRNIKKIT